MENDRKAKQTYLRDEILQKGYDPELFIEYLETIKQNGSDVDNWSFQDLRLQVGEFKDKVDMGSFDRESIQRSGISIPEQSRSKLGGIIPSSQDNSRTQSKINSSNPDKKIDQKIISDANEPLITEDDDSPIESPLKKPKEPGQTLAARKEKLAQKLEEQDQKRQDRERIQEDRKCQIFEDTELITMLKQRFPTEAQKMTKSDLVNPFQLQVKIKKHERIKGTMMKSDYSLFTIETMFKHTKEILYTVKRRFSHFEWLHKNLQNRFPMNYVPQLPPKKLKNKFEEYLIRKRKGCFECFLNTCLQSTEFIYSPDLYVFLQADEASFEKYRGGVGEVNKAVPTSKQFTGQKGTSMKVEHIRNSTGDIELISDSQTRMLSRDIGRIVAQSLPLENQAKVLCKELSDNYQRVSNTLDQLVNVMDQIQTIYSKAKRNTQIEGLSSLEKIYYQLKKGFKEYSIETKKFDHSIQSSLTLMFNFNKKELEGIDEQQLMRSSFTAEYKDRQLQLNTTKEKLFTTLDLSKWQIDQNSLQHSKLELAQNKNLAISLMLPNETANVQNLKEFMAMNNFYMIKDTRFWTKTKISRMAERVQLFVTNFSKYMNSSIMTFADLQTKIVLLSQK